MTFMVPMKYKAAIFDMDGLLLDTERVCMSIFEEACQVVNVPFLKNIYLEIIGRNAAGIEEVLKAGYGPDLDYPTLHDVWRERYNAVVTQQAIPVKSGVVELLTWLTEHDIPVAVATSTRREIAEIKLRLSGLDRFFECYATGCEVTQGKPDPEIYQLAARRLNQQPEECVAFEDSNNGVRSAMAAKMHTYQVPDLVEPSDDVKQLGHTILPSLHDVLAELKAQ